MAFAVAHLDGLSVARWAGYEVTVTLKAADWPLTDGLELRRITDVTPYLDGRRRALEQASGYQLG